MKLDLIEIFRTGNIAPLRWGDSDKEIIKIFPDSLSIINDLRDREYPFIEIDGVEFYFEEEGFKDLSEIIIKNWVYTEGYTSLFFDIGWLNNDLNYSEVLIKLDNLKWNYEATKSSYPDVKYLTINKAVTLAFDSDSENRLQKVFIKNRS